LRLGEKQKMEEKTLLYFMNYALARRAPKLDRVLFSNQPSFEDRVPPRPLYMNNFHNHSVDSPQRNPYQVLG
jgi:hypothetical protein